MKLANIILATAIILGVLFLAGLGGWQLKRLAWKQDLIAQVNLNLAAPPLSLMKIEALHKSGGDIEYRPVHLSGVFDHTREQHYYATHKGGPGYFVFTPLALATGARVFVNRGFVPLDRKSGQTRLEGQIAGTVVIDGLSRTAPQDKPNQFVPDNDLQKNIYFWKSLDQMSERAFGNNRGEILPLFVDADASENAGGLPLGGVTRIEFPNSHLQYALTWFGLAGALLAVGGYFLFGRLKAIS